MCRRRSAPIDVRRRCSRVDGAPSSAVPTSSQSGSSSIGGNGLIARVRSGGSARLGVSSTCAWRARASSRSSSIMILQAAHYSVVQQLKCCMCNAGLFGCRVPRPDVRPRACPRRARLVWTQLATHDSVPTPCRSATCSIQYDAMSSARRLASVRLISLMGCSASYIALISALYERTGSAAWVSAALFAGVFVSVICAPSAGYFGDRF